MLCKLYLYRSGRFNVRNFSCFTMQSSWQGWHMFWSLIRIDPWSGCLFSDSCILSYIRKLKMRIGGNWNLRNFITGSIGANVAKWIWIVNPPFAGSISPINNITNSSIDWQEMDANPSLDEVRYNWSNLNILQIFS